MPTDVESHRTAGGAGARERRAAPRGRRWLALLALVVGALAASAALPARAQTAPPSPSWRDRFERGLEELREGRYEESARTFEGLVEERPEQPEPYYNVACARALAGDPQRALAWLERAIDSGFRDLRHVEEDPDLDPLRFDAAFYALLEAKLGRAAQGPWLRTSAGDPAWPARLRGQVVVLCLWSPLSEASVEALVTLDALQEEARGRGLVVLGAARDDAAVQERLADEKKLGVTLLVASGPPPRPLREQRALPQVAILDRQGRLRHHLLGAPTREELDALLEPLFAAGPEPRRLPTPPPAAKEAPAPPRGSF